MALIYQVCREMMSPFECMKFFQLAISTKLTTRTPAVTFCVHPQSRTPKQTQGVKSLDEYGLSMSFALHLVK